MLYISMKCHENILKVSHETTIVEFQRKITLTMYSQELRFLCCAHCLLMLYISVKFHENILKGFQVIERTQNDRGQSSKGNNYKSTVLVLCTLSAGALYFFEVS